MPERQKRPLRLWEAVNLSLPFLSFQTCVFLTNPPDALLLGSNQAHSGPRQREDAMAVVITLVGIGVALVATKAALELVVELLPQRGDLGTE